MAVTLTSAQVVLPLKQTHAARHLELTFVAILPVARFLTAEALTPRLLQATAGNQRVVVAVGMDALTFAIRVVRTTTKLVVNASIRRI